MFVDPVFQAAPFGNYRLASTSPLIDAADPATATATDLDVFPRPFDGDGDMMAIADIGAYEFPSGEILNLHVSDKVTVTWDLYDPSYQYNLYRGALDLLTNQNVYTQNPALPIPEHFCGIPDTLVPFNEPYAPPDFVSSVFYLVTATRLNFEGTLGRDWTGAERIPTFTCP